jgi:SET domain-containing protein
MRLSDLIYTAPSEIHGTGVFARCRIESGTHIGTYRGPNAKRNGTYVLWVYEEGSPPQGRSGRNQLRYLNHARPGNAEFDGFELYSLRRIEPDEEITFDYGWEEE